MSDNSSGRTVCEILRELTQVVITSVQSNLRKIGSRELIYVGSGLMALTSPAAKKLWDTFVFLTEKVGILSKGIKAIEFLWNWFRSLFKKKSEPGGKRADLHHSIVEHIPESIRPGSVPAPMSHARGEVIVNSSRGYAFGKGCRLFNALVVPDHVVQAASQAGDGSIVIFSAFKGSAEYQHKIPNVSESDKYHFILTDISALVLPSEVWSRLGVPFTNIGLLSEPTFASITGASGNGTSGKLKSNFNIGFGIVEYLGSTAGGYSGGLYRAGNVAYGMHLNGGSTNTGMNLDYIRAVLKRTLKEEELCGGKQESDQDTSLDWAEKEWFDGDQIRKGVKVNKHTEDEITVFVKGKYHVLDRDAVYKRFKGSRWTALQYRDEEIPESSVFRQSPPGALAKNSKRELNHAPQANSNGTIESSQLLKTLQEQGLESLSKTQKKVVDTLRRYKEDCQQIFDILDAQASK